MTRCGDLHVTKECSAYQASPVTSARSRPRASRRSRGIWKFTGLQARARLKEEGNRSSGLQARNDKPTASPPGVDQLLRRKTRPCTQIGEKAFHGARPDANNLGGIGD